MFVNLKRYGLIGILIIWLFVMILGLVYQKGKDTGANEIKQYYAKIEQANTAYWQNKVNMINESSINAKINNQIKYESLNNEFIKISDNLNKCKYNVNQLRSIQSAANVQISTDSNMGDAARTRITTDSEIFTAQDAGLTLIAWGKQYFNCKTKLDYLQVLIQPTQNLSAH